MIKYDKLMTKLKENGWTTYKIYKEKLLGKATYEALRMGSGGISDATIDRLCKELRCQPGDLMEYVPEE